MDRSWICYISSPRLLFVGDGTHVFVMGPNDHSERIGLPGHRTSMGERRKRLKRPTTGRTKRGGVEGEKETETTKLEYRRSSKSGEIHIRGPNLDGPDPDGYRSVRDGRLRVHLCYSCKSTLVTPTPGKERKMRRIYGIYPDLEVFRTVDLLNFPRAL